jgi:predicted ATPase/DNA-binding NarL/FixJ family response regulator
LQSPEQLHNLPTQSTPFIGRHEELAAVVDLLASPACRLLTLAGPGGIGKTRLAIEVAARMLTDFADGVYFVALAPITSVEYVISAISDAIGFQSYHGGGSRQQLFNYLSEKQLLLGIDNFEHLLESTELVAEILEAAPDVKILTTSREALNLQEEWVRHVEGLRFPQIEDVEEIEAYSAVQLFTDRASRVRDDFSLVDNWACVSRVCQLVEGMPLAIELAASWLKTLPCAEIAEEIGRNVDFLATRLRNVPERHRSIQAVFEQSWQLLAEQERDVFMKLSVFRGGFRREAAAQVAGASLATLSALVDKSLLRADPSGRYTTHELLRQYAEKRLDEMPVERQEVQDLHCDYYAEFLDQRKTPIRSGVQQEALAEMDNVRTAWRWAVTRGRVAVIHKFVFSLHSMYEVQGWHEEGEDAFRSAAEALRMAEPSDEQGIVFGQVLAYQGVHAFGVGQLERGHALLQEGLAILRKLDAWQERALVQVLAADCGDTQDVEKAKQALQESITIFRESEEQWGTAFALTVLGTILLCEEGKIAEARECYQEALTINNAIKDRRGAASTLQQLGWIAFIEEEYEKARQYYQEVLPTWHEIGYRLPLAEALAQLGIVARFQGEHAESKQLHLEALTNFREFGSVQAVARGLINLGRPTVSLGEYEEAAGYYYEALRLLQEADPDPFVSLAAVVGMAILIGESGDKARAAEWLSLAALHTFPILKAEHKLDADAYLVKLEAEITPEDLAAARERGQALDLQIVMEAMLDEVTPADQRAESTARLVSPQAARTESSLVEPLTEREYEVLQLIAAGLSNRDIADQLYVGVSTVKKHINHLYGKLGVESRTQAIIRGQELKLL